MYFNTINRGIANLLQLYGRMSYLKSSYNNTNNNTIDSNSHPHLQPYNNNKNDKNDKNEENIIFQWRKHCGRLLHVCFLYTIPYKICS